MQSLLVDVGENVPKEEEAFQKVEDERDQGEIVIFRRFVNDQIIHSINS